MERFVFRIYVDKKWYGISETHFRVGSAFFTLSVTIERYMAISKPLYLNKNRLNFILITASVGTSLVYNFPRFFEFQSQKILREDIQKYNDTAGKSCLSERSKT